MSEPIDQELLPCPFCGGKPTVSNFPGAHNIWCSNQPVKCGNRSMYKLDAWQARASVQPAGGVVPEFLPCDVRLPPATTIMRGCATSTLLASLAMRENLPTDLQQFAAPHPVSGEPTTDELHRLDKQCRDDVAGLVEAAAEMFDMLEWRAGDTGDLLLSNDQRDEWAALLAAYRAQQGEPDNGRS